MPSWLKWLLTVLVLIGAVSVVATRVIRAEAPGKPSGPAYKDVRVERGHFRLSVSANGVVKPIDRIELKSKASGEIVELTVEPGDEVPMGALIARLDQVDERAALAQARANLDIAQAELALADKNHQRRQDLFTSDIIAEEERDQTELNLAVAKGKLIQATTELERAEERMADSVITAPVAGVILQKYVETGQIIASGVSNVGGGTPIADIADMSRVQIEAGIDEIDIGKIQVGQSAGIQAEAYPDQRYQGQVVRIAPEARIEQNVTLFDVIIAVENTDGNLKSGMNANVTIMILNKPDVLLVPATAVSQGPEHGQGQVLLKSAEGYQPRDIRTGLTDFRVFEVLEGLSEGEMIGIPMVSRLKADNDRLAERIRSSRSFGPSNSNSDRQRQGNRSGGG